MMRAIATFVVYVLSGAAVAQLALFLFLLAVLWGPTGIELAVIYSQIYLGGVVSGFLASGLLVAVLSIRVRSFSVLLGAAIVSAGVFVTSVPQIVSGKVLEWPFVLIQSSFLLSLVIGALIASLAARRMGLIPKKVAP